MEPELRNELLVAADFLAEKGFPEDVAEWIRDQVIKGPELTGDMDVRTLGRRVHIYEIAEAVLRGDPTDVTTAAGNGFRDLIRGPAVLEIRLMGYPLDFKQ